MLNIDEIEKRTVNFYSCFCGMDLTKARLGIQYVCSPQRDHILKGYGSRYTIFILKKDRTCIISYSPSYQSYFGKMDRSLDIRESIASIGSTFPLQASQLMIFKKECVFDYKDAKMLMREDFPLYESFFKKANPSVIQLDWLKEYFDNKANKGMLFGYYVNGELASVCDAPDMPYMEGLIQHTGVMTLPEYRRKGYGKCCAAMAAHHCLETSVVPQWECDAENKASMELAKKIGYECFAEAYYYEE